jgi:hypothetical protein
MSKIALTPNAAGTGVFTISSPATNTNRTLTLPDITGTLVSTDASGNVGIGTSSPSSATWSNFLQVEATYPGVVYNSTAGGSNYKFSTGADDDKWLIRDETAGATRLIVDASGNVGIGTSSPDELLHIHGATQSYIKLTDNDSGQGATDGALFAFDGSSATQYIWNYENGPIVFATNSTERCRIDSSGNLLVGTTTVGLQNNMSCGFVGLNTTSYAVINHTSGTGGGNYYAAFGYNGSAIGSITQNGTTGVSYNTSSDYRLKTDAQPMTGASARVQALKPVNFEWITDGTRVDGFLAHEAQAVVPECVTGTKDAMRDEQYEVTAAVYEDIIIAAVLDEEGNEIETERTEQRLVTEAVMGTRSVPDYQGIDQSKLVPLLTAALQEALTEISALKVRVAALEAV